jgi:hypothetical protein
VQVFVYTPKLLYISWGVAILYSLFTVLIGLFSLFKNGQSYTNNFSTVFRATQNIDAKAILLPHDTTGADPLPERLAKRTFTLEIHPDSHGGSSEETERYPL